MSKLRKMLSTNTNTLLILITMLMITVLDSFFKDKNPLIILILVSLILVFIVLAITSYRNKRKKTSLNDFLVYPLLVLFGFMYNAQFYPNSIIKTIVLALTIGLNLKNAEQIDMKINDTMKSLIAK